MFCRRLALSMAFAAAVFLAETPAMAKRVRVATFNVLNGVGATNSSEYAAMKSILRRIDADVVAFQELMPADSNNWMSLASELGYSYCALGTEGPFDGGLYVGFQSRFPILGMHSVTSPPGAAELTRAPLCIAVGIPDAAKPLVLWTMHHKAEIDDLNSFRRAVEALRITQDMDRYRADFPLNDEFVFMGDMNDYAERATQAASFTNLPAGLPGGYALGSDVAFPVAYKVYPLDRYGGGGGGMQALDARQQGTTNSTTMVHYDSRIDYVFASTALCSGAWGNMEAEVYNSACDAETGGLAKAGAPLPAGTSSTASDHYPVFADLFMADLVSTNLALRAEGDDSFTGVQGGPFVPANLVFVLTNQSAGSIDWSANAVAEWFEISPTNGTLPGGAGISLVVTLTDSADILSRGIYEGILYVAETTSAHLAYGRIGLSVFGPPALSVRSSSPASFEGLVGGPFRPTSLVYTVVNDGDFPLDWSAAGSADWLTLTSGGGTLAAQASTNVRAEVNANADALAEGLHVATNLFANLSNGLGTTTDVATLRIFWGGVIHVSAADGSDENSGSGWENPKRTIQAAVDAALESVLVGDGVYAEGGRIPAGETVAARVVLDRPIAVRSLNGPANTIIVGCVPADTTEVRCVWTRTNSVLSGFTLTNGFAGTGGSGGGIFAGAAAVISNCVIAGCSAGYGGGACGGMLYNCTLSGNSAWGGGGADNSELNNCLFSGNVASNGGGARRGVLTDCELNGNRAVLNGGGANTGTLLRCTLTGNVASNGGGAYACTLDDCTLADNRAKSGGGSYHGALSRCRLGGNAATNGNGGGTCYGELDDCTLSNNSATAYGGGAYQGALSNVVLIGNSANYGGGAGYGTLVDCALTGNSAAYGGGAYQGALSRCTLGGNGATRGGGANNSALIDCALADNSATSGGGAYYGTLNNCLLAGNSASNGGGAFYGALSHCTLAGNRATGSGGGSYNGALSNCTLAGNVATNGGGLYQGTASRCAFSNHSARYGGGAYYGWLDQCQLNSNAATLYGGGAYRSFLSNCTVAGNSAASGGGVYLGTQDTCIVYFNSAVLGPNAYGGTGRYTCATPLQGGVGNIDGDPRFADAASGNFRLQADSPCIDAGNPAIPGGTDLNGVPWPLDGNADGEAAADMGAFEFAGEIADTDRDGMSDAAEVRADTNPSNAGSRLELLEMAVSEGLLRLDWMGGIRATQYLERCVDLASTGEQWEVVFTNLPPTPNPSTFAIPPDMNVMRYFRIRIAP